MERFDFKKGFNIRRFILTFSVFLLVSYGLFNARSLIVGPSVEIFSPTQNTETYENIVELKGRAKNTTFISINEKPIFIDTEGLFQEKLLLSPGSNIIQIKAKDRFKKEIQKTINVYYKQ